MPASCWTIIAGVFPVNAFGVAVHLTPFASAAGGSIRDQGGAAAARPRRHDRGRVGRGRRDLRHRVLRRVGGSGAERGHHLRPQRQRGVHEHRRPEVRRHPGGCVDDDDAGELSAGGQKKDIARIMAAHGIPYVATLATGLGADAAGTSGRRSRGPPRCRASDSCTCWARVRRAGDTRRLSPTELGAAGGGVAVLPAARVRPRSVEDHVPAEARAAGAASSSRHRDASATSRPRRSTSIQAHVDERWELLAALDARAPAAPAVRASSSEDPAAALARVGSG